MAEPQRQEILTQALDVAASIGDKKDRAELLTSLAPLLPGSKRYEILAQALDAAASIGDECHRANALASLAPHLTTWAKEQPSLAYSCWCLGVRILANNGRPELLDDLKAMIDFPLALAAGKEEETAVAIFQAIQDTGRWWP